MTEQSNERGDVTANEHRECPSCDRLRAEVVELRRSISQALNVVCQLGEAVQLAEVSLRRAGVEPAAIHGIRKLLHQAGDRLDALRVDDLFRETEIKSDDNDS